MYTGLLHGHSMLRWAVIALLAVATLHALVGWLANRDYERVSRVLAITTLIVVNLEFLIGFGLYLLSPVTSAAFADFEAAMQDRQLRFFTLEHPIAMVLAVVFAHLGSLYAKNGPTDRIRHRRTAIFFGLALVAVLAAIPWWRGSMP